MAANLVYGIHAVQAIIDRQPDHLVELLLVSGSQSNARLQKLAQAARPGVKVREMSRQALDEITDGATHQGVAAYCRGAEPRDEGFLQSLMAGLKEPAFFLVLDGIQDPHNLGACLRTADAAGAHAVIAPRDKSVGLTPAVRKVASGAAERIPFVQVTNLARTLAWLQQEGVWITGMALEATQSLYDMDFKGAIAVVIGAEGAGARRLTREHCDYLVRIPMAEGAVESLNASVAAAVVMFEARRQRLVAKKL